ncbi:secreted protein [gut metagenome]|uniref:Secreted protein n=1 Tax=gut metagenome TaxID=749906 RepID=J9GNG0_9ZZZZ
MKKSQLMGLALAALLGMSCSDSKHPSVQTTMTKETLMDKVKGGWGWSDYRLYLWRSH